MATLTYKGFTVWITGLSGAGKTTLAQLVHRKLQDIGVVNLEILDGDIIRKNLSRGLGFSKKDRDENVRRVGFVCKLLGRNEVPSIVALISPYREARDEVRSEIENFIEVYAKCPIEVCERRDNKGLYKKARAGQIKDFTGIDSPYEPPLNPDVICDTENEELEACADKVISKLKDVGFISFKTKALPI